jgi:CrcB protein
MKIVIVIGTGSFIGGALRFLLSQFVQSKFLSAFPYGTLTVNITGCLLIGLVFGLADRGNITQEWRMFLATGLLGGFTTFSAFSNETIAMLRDGQFIYAATYVAASVVMGLAATFIGITIIKLF